MVLFKTNWAQASKCKLGSQRWLPSNHSASGQIWAKKHVFDLLQDNRTGSYRLLGKRWDHIWPILYRKLLETYRQRYKQAETDFGYDKLEISPRQRSTSCQNSGKILLQRCRFHSNSPSALLAGLSSIRFLALRPYQVSSRWSWKCKKPKLQITRIMRDIPKEEYKKTFEKWLKRMELCIKNDGHYFEHLIK